jgi:hypothetical protein
MAAGDHRPPASPRGPVLVLVAVLLTLGLLVAAIRPEWRVDPIVIDLPEASYRPPSIPPPPSEAGVASQQPQDNLPAGAGLNLSWVRWVFIGLGITAAAIVIGLLVMRWMAIRQLKDSQPDEALDVVGEITPDLPTLQQGAARAEERLLAIGNPTDAIIAAWLALEEAADASGVHHQPSQTPTEFTTEVLGQTGVDAEPVQTLLGLYLRARFGAGPSSAEDLETARRCVRQLAASWQDFAESGASGR